MVLVLDSWLRNSDKGLEFGSGRSTLWLARKVSYLVSVENNPVWHKMVAHQLEKEGLSSRIDYRLHADGASNLPDCRYVGVTQEFPDEMFDFCLIDGVARDYCAVRSIRLLRPGGLLIIDNANRYIPREQKSNSPVSRGLQDGYASETWAVLGRLIAGWRCIWTTDGVTDTAAWLKPTENDIKK
jgi:predicted O-methyltransferase YrrM